MFWMVYCKQHTQNCYTQQCTLRHANMGKHCNRDEEYAVQIATGQLVNNWDDAADGAREHMSNHRLDPQYAWQNKHDTSAAQHWL